MIVDVFRGFVPAQFAHARTFLCRRSSNDRRSRGSDLPARRFPPAALLLHFFLTNPWADSYDTPNLPWRPPLMFPKPCTAAAPTSATAQVLSSPATSLPGFT